jgi:hypothetical protein
MFSQYPVKLFLHQEWSLHLAFGHFESGERIPVKPCVLDANVHELLEVG